MQIYLTIPGIKKQSIIIPDNATLTDFAREAFDKTGARIFEGLGLGTKAPNPQAPVLPVESAINNLTLVKPNGTVINLSNAAYSATLTSLSIADQDELQCWNNPLGSATQRSTY